MNCFTSTAGRRIRWRRARIFLETAKLTPEVPSASTPLTVPDKKSGRKITATSLGNGQYQITADGPEEGKAARIEGVVGGLVRLAEVEVAGRYADLIAFAYQSPHDPMIGLLLPRALNVRAILREEESAGTRGLLVGQASSDDQKQWAGSILYHRSAPPRFAGQHHPVSRVSTTPSLGMPPLLV